MGSAAAKAGPAAKPHLTLLLAAPRGFCAGVDRAIRIVELALQKFGPPVYVRHEIVHNRFVVERLERMGAVFIDELDQAPDGARVIFSAHGVPKSVPAEAERRKLFYLDATCPLVSKVHVEAERHYRAGRQIVLIGHAGHPEVEGTMGQLPDGAITLIETRGGCAARSRPPIRAAGLHHADHLVGGRHRARSSACCKRRFPAIAGPHKEDICYATTNRQEAMKAIAPPRRCRVRHRRAEFVQFDAAGGSGADAPARNDAALIQRASDIDWSLVGNARRRWGFRRAHRRRKCWWRK